MVRKQKSNKKRNESYVERRKKPTEVQDEYLVERHVIKPSHNHYKLLDEYAHKANNVYNQGLYRVGQALLKGEWIPTRASLKKLRNQRDCLLVYE